jgi:enoyl-CoA hydratase
MGGTRIDLQVADGAAWITLDGPERRNALDARAVADLVAACDRIDADPSVGAAVVTGAGTAFCSGADTAVLERLRNETPAVRAEELSRLYSGFRRFGALRVPTIAAVNGPAVGAGLNLALAADLRVLARDAVLVSGFSHVGIHPGGGHLHLLAQAGGSSVAAGMGVFAQRMPADRAVASGLAWAVVEPENLRSTVEGMIRHLAAGPELARALAASLRSAAGGSVAWDAATGEERDRQVWSLGRTGRET